MNEQGRTIRAHVNAFLEEQEAHTVHKSVRKRFPLNAYVVDILDLWQNDLLDLQKFAKYNDNDRYVLSVTDVFQSNYI
jgi:hypothetical protein